jgi:LmbE family N-acetylglucosaminyl deacetylase
MVIGAHAFDAEVMAGHIIAKYTQAGHRATIVHMTLGEKGHKSLPPAEYAEQKMSEARRSAQILGADVQFLPYADAELPVDDNSKYALCDIIRATKPNLLITHWKGSIHKDHTNTHLIVEDARFYAALSSISRPLPAHGAWGLFYAENWEDPDDFAIDTYVDIGDVYDQWLEACRQYALGRGEVSSFRYMDYYTALATMRGCMSGYKYAAHLCNPKCTCP